MGAPKNLGVKHFPDPVGHFEAPWWPFWIFEGYIEGMIESSNNLRFDLFPDPVGILDKPGGKVLQA